jgi:hypothetical protein
MHRQRQKRESTASQRPLEKEKIPSGNPLPQRVLIPHAVKGTFAKKSANFPDMVQPSFTICFYLIPLLVFPALRK